MHNPLSPLFFDIPPTPSIKNVILEILHAFNVMAAASKFRVASLLSKSTP